MRLFVKICGLATPEAVDAAVAAGADAVGFVFHAPSPRHVEPRLAAALARRLPPGVASVAVTLRPGADAVARVLAEFQPDAWQADAGIIDALVLPEGIERWPVVRGPVAVPGRRLLFDARASGAGLRADWQAATAIAPRCELILAGGLDPANVAEAIAAVQPFGVDVSTGVERAPGLKDPARIHAFVAAARGAALRQSA
jgi:phosphoribosylanthranilate isomerase